MWMEKRNMWMGRMWPAYAAIPLFFGVLMVAMSFFGWGASWLLSLLPPPAGEESSLLSYCIYEGSSVLAVLVASLLLFRLEGRPWSELGLSVRGHGRGWLYGFLLAAVFYGIGFGLSLVLGEVKVTGVHWQPGRLAGAWLFFLLVALFLSASLFGLLHLFNPYVGLLPLVNLVLAGMMLGASYLYTRNLCFPVSLHLFWNWIQGPVLGYPVSGMGSMATCLQLQVPHPTALNGGAFGFEGSLLCTVLVALSTGWIIYLGERGRF